jgi:short-subunit dehydrogenase
VAMAAVLGEVRHTTAAEFRRVTEVTYLGSVHGALAALKRMLPRDRGKIVQVGSALGRRGIPLQATYCGAKHAIQGFVESLRAELIHEGSNVEVTIVQLPGLNTTQFGWVRLKQPVTHEPQPVAPIYQPEIAADAVHWAAHHRRRQVYVGISTVYTVLGSKFAPWIAERYLAKTAVKGQQTEGPPDAQNKEGNLMEPQPGDLGARGRFSDKAHERSPQLWATKHRGLLAAAGAAVAGAVGVLASRAER